MFSGFQVRIPLLFSRSYFIFLAQLTCEKLMMLRTVYIHVH